MRWWEKKLMFSLNLLSFLQIYFSPKIKIITFLSINTCKMFWIKMIIISNVKWIQIYYSIFIFNNRCLKLSKNKISNIFAQHVLSVAPCSVVRICKLIPSDFFHKTFCWYMVASILDEHIQQITNEEHYIIAGDEYTFFKMAIFSHENDFGT